MNHLNKACDCFFGDVPHTYLRILQETIDSTYYPVIRQERPGKTRTSFSIAGNPAEIRTEFRVSRLIISKVVITRHTETHTHTPDMTMPSALLFL